MNEVIKFLKENPVQYFATVGLDGKAKVRPFQFIIEEKGKLYFSTSNQKTVFSEIEKNPYIEICTASPNFAWLRLNGKVVFSKDLEIKEKVLNSSELVKSIYKEATNPIFEVFYLEDAKAVIADFLGNPPKEYTL
ncbi:pyridoxamine 5'-phosphate oxidase family protein [Clostridium perfringens]|uniref:pyridoxamine 5'-phosphate oxidase family protein n=1 Tax=Clostridium perfringens TaxID=1502 RepID=UPI000A4C274C|nr:pyridoxamine 5'-phosphate oxidase family protein [Clostridium perfringens]MCS4586018.1 pyridoxamine 5'-phosphate oxidase [Clostridium perfringens]MDU2655041.1 pyridoxamine 5'-phosphate oxidase family protein [Clostridium perfringens]MDU7782460.1 pyridoxamine 5'-phosphate oxidase family protein [Clostridium perfringens]MDU7897617.1 pyridoxamine 5'-phosphate oxidase family protein [Clostridium perfringens]MDZ5045944.1 pyridoxamine 5'-phosphate oxidase [Clostridium perfringens]